MLPPPPEPTVHTPVKLDHLYKAQFGEDRILWNVFKRKTSGYFIEIGAYDGVTLSNTFFLEKVGWTGVLVEPIEELCNHARAHRPRSTVVHAACSRRGSPDHATFTIARNVPVLSYLHASPEHVERCKAEGAELVEVSVPVTTVNDMLRQLRQTGGPDGPWKPDRGWNIDLVSIDTEGCELDVLDGFDLDRFKPAILVIENDRPEGSRVEPYLQQRGYRKFHRQKINDFFVRLDGSEEELDLEINPTA